MITQGKEFPRRPLMHRDYKHNCPCPHHPFECFGHPTTCQCADDDNSQLFARSMVCLGCEENFTLGEMYPGKQHTDPMQCPYCRSDNAARHGEKKDAENG